MTILYYLRQLSKTILNRNLRRLSSTILIKNSSCTTINFIDGNLKQQATIKTKNAGHEMAIVREPCNVDAHAKIPALFRTMLFPWLCVHMHCTHEL